MENETQLLENEKAEVQLLFQKHYAASPLFEESVSTKADAKNRTRTMEQDPPRQRPPPPPGTDWTKWIAIGGATVLVVGALYYFLAPGKSSIVSAVSEEAVRAKIQQEMLRAARTKS
jgi:hypothetical protein